MLGRTNTGGGGTGGILTVTAPAGVTVTVSKDGKSKTKTANADGVAVFKGLATGSWTLTITDGTQTATKMVDITADYNSVIAFFSATISITYPAGSICTCSDGSTTFTAPDTSGSWVCVVPNTGTWTVKATNGTNTSTDTVSITTNEQRESVSLSYLVVFANGAFTKGSFGKKLNSSQYSVVRINSDYNAFEVTCDTSGHVIGYTTEKFDLTGVNTLRFIASVESGSNAYEATCYMGVSNTQGDFGFAAVTNFATKNALGSTSYDVDVSQLSGSYYIKAITDRASNSSYHKLFISDIRSV